MFKCVIYYCHRLATQLNLTNLSYPIISCHIIQYHIVSYHIIYHVSHLHVSTPKDVSTVKDKVNPLNAWTGPKRSRKFRIPVERKSDMKVVWFSALAPAAFTLRKYSWCSFFVRGWVYSSSIVRLKYFIIEITMTKSGIEPATVRLVTKCLNQLRHSVPQIIEGLLFTKALITMLSSPVRQSSSGRLSVLSRKWLALRLAATLISSRFKQPHFLRSLSNGYQRKEKLFQYTNKWMVFTTCSTWMHSRKSEPW
jgi:hypothetical protein